MRPLHLTVSGLHSYRDEVEVDFEELGRYGLFGIFGKIGSGKSTLLDAITLALYGLVDRVASRSRKGIVHLGSDRCEVRFRFAVDGRAGAEEYEVHRLYRADPRSPTGAASGGNAQRVGSRLVRLGPSRFVIAEKETEVNEAVAEIVGLGPEDFMRAVALPQGRFLQLLHLKGQDRRQMLQRIFRLQAYGEDLRRRIRDRHAGARNRLAEVRGELLGMGDCSAAAVRRASAEADEAQEARDRADGELAASRVAHDGAARARAHRERLATARAELDGHRAGAADHQALEERLRTAEQVRPLVGPARRLLEAQVRFLEVRAHADATELERARETAREAVAEVALGSVRQRRRTAEPELRTRLARLEEAVAFEAERTELVARAEGLEAESRTAETAMEAARDAWVGARERMMAAEKERRRIKRELARQRVSPEERERFGAARRAADAVHAARRFLEEARRDEAAARATFDAAGDGVAAAEAVAADATRRHEAARAAVDAAEVDPARLEPGRRAAIEQDLAEAERRRVIGVERRAELDAARAAAERTEAAAITAETALEAAEAEKKAARQILRGADVALRDAEQALASAQERAAAATLAGALQPGKPCAVCGSPHHPSPAIPPSELPQAAVDAHRVGRDRAAKRHEQALATHGGAAAVLDAARVAATQAAARRVAAEAAAAEVAPGEADPSAWRALLEADAAAERRLSAARGMEATAALTLERVGSPLAAARARRDGAANEAARATTLREARAGEEGEAWASFEHERGDLTLFDVGSAAAAIDARDRRVQELEGALEAVDSAHAEIVREAGDHRAEAGRLEAWLARSRERASDTRALVVERTERIVAQAGDRRPAEVLAEVGGALAALLAEVEAAEETAGQVRQAREEASRAHATAEAEARAVAAERDAARAELERVAGRAVPDVERLVEGCPDEQTLAAWRLRLEEWRQRAAVLETRLQALLEHDDGAGVLDDAAWAALVERHLACERRAEAARDRSIALLRVRDELALRTDRHAELVADGERLDRDLARLDELSQLVRGDRFVEYVANDHLVELTARASAHLADLTSNRYALALDEELAFVVRDDDMGGLTRPVHTLSGGESFLTALSLALALSTQVQARAARPLGFFFLDEGFGTLDPEALDRVLTAIERLRDGSRVIGLISHVPGVRERVPRYLWVERLAGSGGSTVEVREN